MTSSIIKANIPNFNNFYTSNKSYLMTIICKTIENITQLTELKKQWGELNYRTNNGCIFTSPEWLLNWYHTFWQKNYQLVSVAIFREEHLIAFLPFYYQEKTVLLKEKKLYLLGQGEQESSEVASEYLDILVEPTEKNNIKALVNQHYINNTYDSIHIRAIKKDANVLQLFPIHYQLSGYQYLIEKKHWSRQLLSKNNRKRHSRCQNQLAHLNSKFIWIKPCDFEVYWQKMADFHQKRWQAKQEVGAFSHQQFHQFHQTLYAKRHYVYMSALQIEEEIIAVNYYLADDTTLYFYQSGWNETQHKKLSPGFALHIWSIENSDKNNYDFMMGQVDDSYKSKFNCEKYPLYDVNFQFKPIKQVLLKILKKIIST